jgi:signal transduction histidine kinase
VVRADVSGGAELLRLSEERATLRRVATLVASGAPRDRIFEAIIAEIGRLVPADGAAIASFHGDEVTVLGTWKATGGYRPDGRRYTADPGTLARAIADTRRPARVKTYAGVEGALATTWRTQGWRSSVGAPIVVDACLWGMVLVASTSERQLPLGTERRLAEFTELLASAIAGAQSREDLARLAEEQAALRRVATLVAQAAPARHLLAAVAAQVARVLHVPTVSILRYEDDGTASERASFSDGGELFPVGRRWTLNGASVVAAVWRTGRPARIDGYEGLDGEIAAACRAAGIVSTVGSPLVVAGRVWGVMVASSLGPDTLPEATAARLRDFTELVATAIANAESRAEVDASRARIVATADATRRRIERDLHDGAQQRLVTLALTLRATHDEMPADRPELRAQVAQVADGLTAVIDELRELARGIHPAALSDRGLGAALRALARRSTTPVTLDLRCEARLPEPVEVAAYFVVSEALTNVAKHARASEAQVRVEMVGDDLRVAVRDDGIGGARPGAGSGLVGLKDRVEALGGTIGVDSPPDGGTRLVATIPCARTPE